MSQRWAAACGWQQKNDHNESSARPVHSKRQRCGGRASGERAEFKSWLDVHER